MFSHSTTTDVFLAWLVVAVESSGGDSECGFWGTLFATSFQEEAVY
jgi:hypothetical protein